MPNLKKFPQDVLEASCLQVWDVAKGTQPKIKCLQPGPSPTWKIKISLHEKWGAVFEWEANQERVLLRLITACLGMLQIVISARTEATDTTTLCQDDLVGWTGFMHNSFWETCLVGVCHMILFMKMVVLKKTCFSNHMIMAKLQIDRYTQQEAWLKTKGTFLMVPKRGETSVLWKWFGYNRSDAQQLQ